MQSYVGVLDPELAAAKRSPSQSRDLGHVNTAGTTASVFDGFDDAVDPAEGDHSRAQDLAASVPAANDPDGGTDTVVPENDLQLQQQMQRREDQSASAAVSDDSDAEGDVKRAQLTRRRLGLAARRRQAEGGSAGHRDKADRDYRRQPSEQELLRREPSDSLQSPHAAEPQARAAADAFQTLGFADERSACIPTEGPADSGAHARQQGSADEPDLLTSEGETTAHDDPFPRADVDGAQSAAEPAVTSAVKATELQQASAEAQSRLAPAKAAGPSPQVRSRRHALWAVSLCMLQIRCSDRLPQDPAQTTSGVADDSRKAAMVTVQHAQPTCSKPHAIVIRICLAIRQWTRCGSCWMPASTASDCSAQPKRVDHRQATRSPRLWAAGDRAAGGMTPGTLDAAQLLCLHGTPFFQYPWWYHAHARRLGQQSQALRHEEDQKLHLQLH